MRRKHQRKLRLLCQLVLHEYQSTNHSYVGPEPNVVRLRCKGLQGVQRRGRLAAGAWLARVGSCTRRTSFNSNEVHVQQLVLRGQVERCSLEDKVPLAGRVDRSRELG